MSVIEIGEYLPLPDGFVRRHPPLVAKRPSDRHDVMRFNAGHDARSKDRNTMIAPWVDVRLDLETINAGRGYYRAEGGRIWVNGRLWAMHIEKQSGTIYPIAGEGLFNVTQREYRAMKILAAYNGINDRSEYELEHWIALSDRDREVARAVWRMREAAMEGTDGLPR